MVSNTDLVTFSEWLSHQIVPVVIEPDVAPEPTEVEIKKDQLIEWGFEFEQEHDEWVKKQWTEKALLLANMPGEGVPEHFGTNMVDAGFELSLQPVLNLLSNEMNLDVIPFTEDLLVDCLRVCQQIIPDEAPTKDSSWDEWLEENDLSNWWDEAAGE